jgi:hypothetical protein
MLETRSPLKDKPLRNPGQSVREQRFDFAYDKVLAPFLMALLMVYVAGMDWYRYFVPAKSMPWFSSSIALVTIAYAAWQYSRHWPKVQALRLAEDGEKAVGQMLESLRASGYQVFHDLVGENFNVDHTIIGPAGVFTIETKTWRKPAKGRAEITFDGETLLANGFEPDRSPAIQAKAQAQWLRQLLADSTGKTYPVRPVVLFPGWFIKNSQDSFKELWVLEPKAFNKFLANEKPVLPPEDVSLAASHLSRFIIAEERRREAAS